MNHPPKPTGKAPEPPKKLVQKKFPLTSLLKEINRLLEDKNHDKAVLKNARATLLELLRDDIPDADVDLKEAFLEAKRTKDNVIIDAILDQFTSIPIQTGELLDELINTYEELHDTSFSSRLMSFFYSRPYGSKLEKIVHLAIEVGEVKLSFEQRKKLLKIACREHDYKFVAELLSVPAQNHEKLEKHSGEIFELLAEKIKEYYVQSTKDIKCAFRLVAIKNIIEGNTLLDFHHVRTAKVKEVADLALAHNNIQFVEALVDLKPKLLRDEEFLSRAIPKYKEALRTSLMDRNSRNGFGIGAINSMLDSKVLEGVELSNIFENQKDLIDILADTDSEYREVLTPKLIERGILKENPAPQNLHELIQDCLKGNVQKIKDAKAANIDLTKIRCPNGRSLLFYAASYEYNKGHEKGDGWPHVVLRKALDEQAKDAEFITLSKQKNEILEQLLEDEKFSKQDIQDAFDKAYRDAVVKRQKNELATQFALHGDHDMMRKLINAGANPAIGKTFIGLKRAIALSYITALSTDTAFTMLTKAIEKRFGVPTFQIYNEVSAATSALVAAGALEYTGAAEKSYHDTFNLEYINNNYLNFDQAILAGSYTHTWYGGIVYGHDLEEKMRKQVGVTNVEDANFDFKDIDDKNVYIHHMIGKVLFNAYTESLQEAEIKEEGSIFSKALTGIKNFITKKITKNSKDDFNRHLEECNKKCQYGIPGDDGYSFNAAFQDELEKLFSDTNVDRTIDSIMCYKKNHQFFLEMAKGIDQGLIKTPLSLKKKILDAYEKVIKKPSLVKTHDRDLPRVFGQLIKLYERHTKESVPLSAMLVAQHYHELKVMAGEAELGSSDKFWNVIISFEDKLVGAIAAKFGATKQEGHLYTGRAVRAVLDSVVGGFNFYEKRFRDEIKEQGVLKSFTFLATGIASSVTALSYAGIKPKIVLPPIMLLLGLMYCRDREIDVIDEVKAFCKKVKNSIVPTADKTETFKTEATRKQYDALYSSIRVQDIPASVRVSL